MPITHLHFFARNYVDRTLNAEWFETPVKVVYSHPVNRGECLRILTQPEKLHEGLGIGLICYENQTVRIAFLVDHP